MLLVLVLVLLLLVLLSGSYKKGNLGDCKRSAQRLSEAKACKGNKQSEERERERERDHYTISFFGAQHC